MDAFKYPALGSQHAHNHRERHDLPGRYICRGELANHPRRWEGSLLGPFGGPAVCTRHHWDW